MMTNDTINVKGLSDLQKALDTLSDKIHNNIMRGALRSGAKVLRDHAKEICPVEGSGAFSKYKASLGWTPGELQRSIRLSARLAGGSVIAKVIAGNKKAFYAHMVEFGTAAHWIKPVDAKALYFGGQAHKAVYHPGARKNPFMRITFDAHSRDAVVQVGEYVRSRLTKEGINIPDGGDESA